MTGPRSEGEGRQEPGTVPGTVWREANRGAVAGTGTVTRMHPEAVLSVGLALIGVLGITSVMAITRGRRAIREIEAEPTVFHGIGTAKAGIVFGWLGVIGYALLYAYLIVVFVS